MLRQIVNHLPIKNLTAKTTYFTSKANDHKKLWNRKRSFMSQF